MVRRSTTTGRMAGRSGIGKKADRSEKTDRKVGTNRMADRKVGKSKKAGRTVGRKVGRKVGNDFGCIQSVHHIRCCNLNFTRHIKTNMIVVRLIELLK
jgi:hypothetical protein